MKKVSCMLMFFVLFTLSCKKDETPILEKIITINTDTLLNIQVQQKLLFESGLDGYQYGYGSIVKKDQNEFLISSSRFSKFADYSLGADIIISQFDKDFNRTKVVSVLQENISDINILAPNLLRINDSHYILIFSVRKDAHTDIELMVKQSYDGGNSWSQPKSINSSLGTGYFVLNNDRVILNNNRIIIPVAYTSHIVDNYNKQSIICFYSDNFGVSWKKSVRISSDTPLMEPGIVALSNTELLMNIRTRTGKILFARSSDNGQSWMLQKSDIDSPSSPQTLKRIPKTDSLLMVWNYTNKDFTKSFNNRTPLSLALSVDKGESWKHILNFEEAADFDYAYPSIFIDDDFVYVNYYERNERRNKVSLKMSKIPRNFKNIKNVSNNPS